MSPRIIRQQVSTNDDEAVECEGVIDLDETSPIEAQVRDFIVRVSDEELGSDIGFLSTLEMGQVRIKSVEVDEVVVQHVQVTRGTLAVWDDLHTCVHKSTEALISLIRRHDVHLLVDSLLRLQERLVQSPSRIIGVDSIRYDDAISNGIEERTHDTQGQCGSRSDG